MKKIYFLIGTLCIYMLGACKQNTAVHGYEHGEEHCHDGEHDNHDSHGDEIVFTAERAKAAGVVSDTLRAGKFRQVIKTGGQILPAPGGETVVTATMNGVVSFSRVLTGGIQVSPGASLFRLSADRIQDGDPAERARIRYEQARTEYERARELSEKQIVTRREVEALKADCDEARLAYEALSVRTAGGGTVVTAPVGGFVKSVEVKEGDYVTVGQPLMTLTRNRRLQLRADVSERYYSMLPRLVSAHFRTSGSDTLYVLEEMNGRVLSYGKADDGSACIPVIFEFDNLSAGVVPGSFAEVYLLGAEREDVLSLPLTAVTEEQGAYFVYIQEGADVYRKQEVRLGAGDGRRVEVIAGLSGGERVVMQGAYRVKLASASAAIPAHTHSH